VPDLEIYRSAQDFIKRYGKDTLIKATIRAGAFVKEGETDGHLVLMRALLFCVCHQGSTSTGPLRWIAGL
jgi:hypothetical protein